MDWLASTSLFLPMGILSRCGLRLTHYWLQNATSDASERPKLLQPSCGRQEVCRGHEPWKQHAHHRRMNFRELRHVKICHERNEKSLPPQRLTRDPRRPEEELVCPHSTRTTRTPILIVTPSTIPASRRSRVINSPKRSRLATRQGHIRQLSACSHWACS